MQAADPGDNASLSADRDWLPDLLMAEPRDRRVAAADRSSERRSFAKLFAGIDLAEKLAFVLRSI
jgi:hypothetical protein